MTKRKRDNPEYTDRLREWDLVSPNNAGFHEAADIFPQMSEEEFAEFKADIAENGLRTPIVTMPSGHVLDGRHRWRACMELKIEPRYQVYRGNPWTYVVSANLHRRHLTNTQRQLVAARLAKRIGGDAGNVRGDRTVASDSSTDVGRGAGRFTRSVPSSRFREDGRPSRADAAALLSVSPDSITRARPIIDHGIPELSRLVEENIVTINTAGRVATTLDKAGQRDYVKRVRDGEDPLKVAPPYKKYDGSKRTIRKPGKDTFTHEHVTNLGSAMVGIVLAFGDVSTLDESVTPESAKRLVSEMQQATSVINRVKKLLIQRSKKGTE